MPKLFDMVAGVAAAQLPGQSRPASLCQHVHAHAPIVTVGHASLNAVWSVGSGIPHPKATRARRATPRVFDVRSLEEHGNHG